MNEEREDTTELRHEPEPGYERIFYIALLIAVLYLCIIFILG
jgi:hypothetical protein